MNYSCSNCIRTFSNKTTLKKHIVYCEAGNEMRNCQNEPNEKKYTEPQRDRLIRMLMYQNHLLKKQVSALANKMQGFQKKRRVEIISWLDAKRKPISGWKEFIKQVDVQEKHFTTALNNTLVEGVEECLDDILRDCISKDEFLPLLAFRQKDKTLYVFEEASWKILEKEAFTKSMQTIVFKIQQFYFIWRNRNQVLLDSSEEWKNKDIEYSRKMMGMDSSNISLLGKLYGGVYDLIKKDFDDLIMKSGDDDDDEDDSDSTSDRSSLT